MNDLLSSFAKNGKYATKNILGSHRVSSLALKPLALYRRHRSTNATDVCISGFPRSGNTFLCEVWSHFNPELQMSHHIHLPFEMYDALKLEIPLIVLIREPLECLSSLLAVDERLSAGVGIWSYLNYYRRIWGERSRYVVSAFPRHVDHVEDITESFNDFWNTSIRCQEVDSTVREVAFANMRKRTEERGRYRNLYAGPRKDKDEIKNRLKSRLEAHPRLEECNELFCEFCSLSI
jgi:hypothetical protein